MQQVRRVPLGRVERRRHPEAEQAIRGEVGGVERVDVGAELLAQQLGQRLLVGELLDALEGWREGSDAAGLDGRLVEEGGVVVTRLARLGACRSLGRSLEELADPLVGLGGDGREDAPPRAIRGNLGAPLPGSVGVAEEVVAGLHRSIHSSEVDGRRGRRAAVGSTEGSGGDQAREGRGQHEVDSHDGGMVQMAVGFKCRL